MPTNAHDIVIAGTGVAASATATALLHLGLRPLLLRIPTTQPADGIEALPPAAVAQIDALRWWDVLAGAGAIRVSGFENGLGSLSPQVLPGPFWHVERSRLAGSALAQAQAAGASVVHVPRLPRPLVTKEGLVLWIDGVESVFRAGVDATGRRAGWAGPCQRLGRQVADLFTCARPAADLRGAVAALADGWAYRLGLPEATTVGVVRPRPSPSPPEEGAAERVLGEELAARWRLNGSRLERPLRKPAFVQWVEDPVNGCLFAVGDAALACDPLAGHGIRFALASSIAAAFCIDLLLSGSESSEAVAYYRDFVASNRRRHLQHLDRLRSHTPPIDLHHDDAWPLPGELSVVRAVPFTTQELRIGDHLMPGTALRLPDGEAVRWLGDYDLLLVATLAASPIRLDELARSLERSGWPPTAAAAVLAWCLRQGLLQVHITGAGKANEFPPRHSPFKE